MSFLETPRFPSCIRYGYQMNSAWSETINSVASGNEGRNRNWVRSLKTFPITMGPNATDDILEAYEFWEALAGPDCGFRFKDWADFKSCRITEDPTSSDQQCQLITGSPGSGYQLQKLYTKGARSTQRLILKPVQGTIQIADVIAGVAHLKVEGTDWVMDYTTGLFQPHWTPGGVVTWGGEFDVPVRFDSDFPLELPNFDTMQVTFQLKELRRPQNDGDDE